MTSEMTPTASPLRSWPPDDATLQSPWRLFEELRAVAPVYLCPEPSPDGTRPYVVTGFDEVSTALTRHEVFINDLTGVLPSHEANLLPAVAPDEPSFYAPSHVFFSDGDDHKVKRSWALKLGERNRLPIYRPIFEEVVDELIDEFIDRGRCDFRADFTERMPLGLVRRIMDLPRDVDTLVTAVSAGIAASEQNPNLPPEVKRSPLRDELEAAQKKAAEAAAAAAAGTSPPTSPSETPPVIPGTGLPPKAP